MKKYAEKTDACKCGHRFFCAEKTARRRLTNQLGFVGVIYTVGRGDSPVRGNFCYNRVGRGLAPAALFDIILRNGQDRSLRL